MKIDAPRAWGAVDIRGLYPFAHPEPSIHDNARVRIVRESDWRKIMAVVKAADPLLDLQEDDGADFYNAVHKHLSAIHALRKHLEKRK